MKASSIRKGEMMTSKRQLGSITSKKNLDESGSRRTNWKNNDLDKLIDDKDKV